RHGGTGPGYATIVGAGENATILHYIANRCAIAEGDLVLVDAGCEYDHYTADITRTWPASGRFTPAQRRVYEIVLDAQLSAIELGLYVAPDAPDVPDELRGIGVRIEDDIAITAGAPEVLTAACPKAVRDLEAVIRG